MYRLITLLVILTVLMSLPASTLADGKVFTKSATAEVNIPDQEALIHWADGVETLIIRTSFTGEGDEFAWVVPTPSEPEVTASTTGLFPTLRTLTAPEVRHPQHKHYFFVWLLVLAVLGIASGRAFDTLIVLVLIAFVIAVFLPSLGAARGGGAMSLQLHQREIVGSYEVVVLSAEYSETVTGWLNNNGFKVSAESVEVIQQYLDEGWYLTATRLRPQSLSEDRASTHPLAFRFPVDEPVYPLRLTATGSDALDVDLYVFGHQRASAVGFDAAYCNRLTLLPDVTEEDWSRPPEISETALRHPELRRRVEPAAFVTKLSATLTPEEMTQDAVIRWDSETTHKPVRWTTAGAVNIAANVTWACWGVAVMSLPFVFPKRTWCKKASGKAVLFVFLATVISSGIGYGVYLSLPKTKAVIHRSHIYWRSLRNRLDTDLLVTMRQGLPPDAGPADARRLFERLEGWLINPMTGDRVYLEDSPGNVIIEKHDGKWCFVAFGPDGAPLRIDSTDGNP